MGSDEITTKEAVQRIRQLLLSMNRFGPYPLLWPMYGCGDLPQGYCRMSAVFGAVFCLGCCLTSIRRYETQSGDNKVSTDIANSTNQPPNFIARLSNGHEVRTQCILIGAEQAPIDWIQSQVHRWCARAVFLTDRSLLVEGRKSTDITMLALPLSGRGENGLDPAILLEIPVEPSRVTDPDLFIVHLTATVREAMDAEQLFRPVIRRLFRPQNQDDGNELTSSHPVESRPKLLWTSYFCLPDLSTVELTVPLAANSDRSRFKNSDGLYVVPGPDLSVHLDSTVITAETIFRAVITQLGIQSNEQQSAATGGSDGPPISTLTSENGNAPPETSESTPYVSLDARWDGLFPPRPPRPEDIVVPTDNEGGQLMDLESD
ncbi:Rab proteins geranylgeranyltransferase component A 1 [Fasciola gigantica]|uniref:Rab proteins geranylgeranyltransferase component A 1 n=1 Tax=Fasciola gigantica TaxID=46835 RepID=A0A504YV65_FASGI|nr:Rab proteins geranylgeranyltransferase component A 1 [Fasciola gigantica]